MPLDPDAGTVLLQELMSEIPHHSYNLLQYLCQLLSRVSLSVRKGTWICLIREALGKF